MFDAAALQAPLIQDLVVLLQVLLIDLTLAGDNAVAVGIAASGLTSAQRRTAILAGLGAAVALRIGFALLATRLLGVIGLTLAGGLILLWVCWKMWRDLRAAHQAASVEGGQAHQGDRQDQAEHQQGGVIARRAGHGQDVVERHREVGQHDLHQGGAEALGGGLASFDAGGLVRSA